MPRSLITFPLAAALLLAGPAARAEDPPPDPPQVSVGVARERFSPNGDGRRDTTRLTVRVNVDANVTLRILDPDRRVRRSWTSTLDGGDTFAVTWDGTGPTGRVLPDGPYRLEAVAVDLEGQTASAVGGVAIDTLAPRIAWKEVEPEPSRGTVTQRFTFSVRDADSAFRGRLTVWNRRGKRVGEVREFTLDSRSATVSWKPPRVLFRRTYTTRIRLVDRAGNVGRAKPRAWRVHRSIKGRVYHRLENTGRYVALTFDDCYETGAWREILRVLRAHGVRASFFCPGETLSSRATLARRTVARGHSVGAHGWDHASLRGRSGWFVRSRLRADRRAWWRYGGATSAPYFRPPYGAYDAQVVRISGEIAMPRVIMWDVDPQDWRRPGTRVLVRRVVDRARKGSIVVLHTIGPTAEALPSILRGLRARNLTPVDLDTLFALAR